MDRLRIGTTDLVLKQGDITLEMADAIVNAANQGLRGGGGVDGAIHRAGGPAIMAECAAIREKQGGCRTGEAVITTAGRLNARVVVHAVGPVWNGGGDNEADRLRSAYANSLRLAAARGCRSIAFPSISTGIYSYPIEKAAPIALVTVRDYVRKHADFDEVRFVLFSADDLAVYEKALSRLRVD